MWLRKCSASCAAKVEQLAGAVPDPIRVQCTPMWGVHEDSMFGIVILVLGRYLVFGYLDP